MTDALTDTHTFDLRDDTIFVLTRCLNEQLDYLDDGTAARTEARDLKDVFEDARTAGDDPTLDGVSWANAYGAIYTSASDMEPETAVNATALDDAKDDLLTAFPADLEATVESSAETLRELADT